MSRPARTFRPRVGRVRPHHKDVRAYITEPLDAYVVLEEMRAAGCTPLEREVVALFLMHQNREAVARELRLPFGIVTVIIETVAAKLEAWRQDRSRKYAFADWKSVYVEEVNRWSYRDEQHCPPGQEACAKDGLCKYRWYLSREQAL